MLVLTLVSNRAARLAIVVVMVVFVTLLNAAFANTVRATNFGAIAAYVFPPRFRLFVTGMEIRPVTDYELGTLLLL